MSDYIKKIQEEAKALGEKLQKEAEATFRYRIDATGSDGLPYIPDIVSTHEQALRSAEVRNQLGCTNIRITDLKSGASMGYENKSSKP